MRRFLKSVLTKSTLASYFFYQNITIGGVKAKRSKNQLNSKKGKDFLEKVKACGHMFQ